MRLSSLFTLTWSEVSGNTGVFSPTRKSARRQVFGSVWILGDGLASWGRPASPFWALFRLRRGFFHFIITTSTAVSVRARWEKEKCGAKGKLLSQLSFSVYAGQVVFRASTAARLRQGAWRQGGVSSDVEHQRGVGAEFDKRLQDVKRTNNICIELYPRRVEPDSIDCLCSEVEKTTLASSRRPVDARNLDQGCLRNEAPLDQELERGCADLTAT